MTAGLSVFHKMVVTVLKTTFLKSKPRMITYRDYRSFDNDKFKTDLKNSLRARNVSFYLVYKEIFVHVLRRHVPIKQEVARANHAPYVTKAMRKAIMKKPNCSIGISKITDNKVFCKTVKPLLSDKGINSTRISLLNDKKVTTEDTEVANAFNGYFETAVNYIGITENKHFLTEIGNWEDPIKIPINKFENHPCILSINETINVEQSFQFSEVTSEEALRLTIWTVGSYKNKPTKLPKETSEISRKHLAKIWNEQVTRSKSFPIELKLADFIPIFKSEDSALAKKLYTLSVLPCVLKGFERIIHKQLSEYMEKNLSPFLFHYRKGFNTLTALLELVEK